jgi:hypothetical protein
MQLKTKEVITLSLADALVASTCVTYAEKLSFVENILYHQ